MFVVEFFTQEDDTYMVVFAKNPSDQEIISYIENHDWLSVEYEDSGLEWCVEAVNFIDNSAE